MKIKKVLALILAVSMLVGMTACGNKEKEPDKEVENQEDQKDPVDDKEDDKEDEPVVDEKPFKGQTVKVAFQWAPNLEKPEDVATTYLDYMQGCLAAVAEWCQINECNYEVLADMNDSQLMAAINAGQQPNLIVSGMNPPGRMALGLCEDLTEYYDYFAEKFGEDNVKPNMYKGSLYGISWGSDLMWALRYEPDWFIENGIKRPAEYWLEGNWNFETYQALMKEITRDTNGDGVNDVVAMGMTNVALAFGQGVTHDPETGKAMHHLGSELNYDLYQMLYEAFTLDGSIIEGYYPSPTTNADGVYIAIGVTLLDGVYYNIYGDNKEYVPAPYWRTEDDAVVYMGNHGGHYAFHIPKGADREISVSLLDYVATAERDIYEIVSMSPTDDFQGLQGSTDISKAYLDTIKKFAADCVAGQDEWYADNPIGKQAADKFVQWMKDTPKWAHSVAGGLTSHFTTGAFDVLYKQPPATSFAEMIPKFDAEITKFNKEVTYTE